MEVYMNDNLLNNQTSQPTPEPTPVQPVEPMAPVTPQPVEQPATPAQPVAPVQPAAQPTAAQIVMGDAPAVGQSPTVTMPQPLGQNEDLAKGIIGAVLGSTIGAAVIAIILLAGYFAALGGIVMGIATIGLYKKLAKGISKKGIVICAICMAVMTYFSVHIAVAVTILNEYGTLYHLSFGDAFSMVWRLAGVGEFWGLLGLTFLFTGFGAVGAIASEFQNLKKQA